MSVKYSFVIPFYKVKPYVADCLDSILAQTFVDWECICIDDGSPDGLGEILDDYAARDNRFKVIHQPNSGVGVARNNALKVVTGEWLLFVDGDDVLPPWALATYNVGMEQYPQADMVICGMDIFKSKEEIPSLLAQRPEGSVFTYMDTTNLFNMEAYSCGFTLRAYRRAVFGDLRFPPLVRGQDRYFLLDCVFRAKGYAISSTSVYWYRNRSDSTTHSAMTAKKVASHVALFKHFFELAQGTAKQVDAKSFRMFSNYLMEVVAGDYFMLKSSADRQSVLPEWLSTVKYVYSNSGNVSKFQKVRMALFLTMPCTAVIYLLCSIPLRIKLSLLHR